MIESENKIGLNDTNNFQSIDTSDKPVCKICNQGFDDTAKLQKHMITEHMDKGEFGE